MFRDPSFWVGLSFVITVALVAKPIWRGMSGSLDARADKIRDQIEEARRLREEAQALLADYQRKQSTALSEAENVITQAKKEAERIKTEASENLEQTIKRRKAQALDRITQSEAQALASIRNMAIDLAITAAEKLIKNNIAGNRQDALVDETIKNLPNQLN
ncbi:MAG: F0F1 ATP synthase subunit B [Rhodospirillaceae bacterium]